MWTQRGKIEEREGVGGLLVSLYSQSFLLCLWRGKKSGSTPSKGVTFLPVWLMRLFGLHGGFGRFDGAWVSLCRWENEQQGSAKWILYWGRDQSWNWVICFEPIQSHPECILLLCFTYVYLSFTLFLLPVYSYFTSPSLPSLPSCSPSHTCPSVHPSVHTHCHVCVYVSVFVCVRLSVCVYSCRSQLCAARSP